MRPKMTLEEIIVHLGLESSKPSHKLINHKNRLRGADMRKITKCTK